MAFVTDLPHFALNDPYYSPYDVTYDVIGNPPLVSLLPLEGQLGLYLGLELRLGLRGLGFPSYSPLWCHNDVIMTT